MGAWRADIDKREPAGIAMVRSSCGFDEASAVRADLLAMADVWLANSSAAASARACCSSIVSLLSWFRDTVHGVDGSTAVGRRF